LKDEEDVYEKTYHNQLHEDYILHEKFPLERLRKPFLKKMGKYQQ